MFGFSVILGIHVSNLIKDSFGCGFFHYINFAHWLHQNRNVVSLGCICLEQMFFEHYYRVRSFPIFLLDFPFFFLAMKIQVRKAVEKNTRHPLQLSLEYPNWGYWAEFHSDKTKIPNHLF